MNAVTKDAKYVKIIQTKPINSQCQIVKFGKFEETERCSVIVIYYLKCKMCNKKETYIGKTKEDNTKGFKVRINQYISDCKTGDSTCKFPRHVYDCGIKNNCLEEPFFSLNIIKISKYL